MRKYFAPGRINLIGEHIDYNGGLVLPAAISLGITAYVSDSDDGLFHLSSAAHEEQIAFSSKQHFVFEKEKKWLNYPLGVFQFLKEKQFSLKPLHIHFESTLPESSGLSSSACIEVLTMFLMLQENEYNIHRKEIAQWSKAVENDFIGVNCGIMDQFCIANTVSKSAMLLNCHTLDFEEIPVHLETKKITILNTRKPRNLITSKYNERRNECEQALSILQKTWDFSADNLCAYPLASVDVIQDELLKKRARHVISENDRAQQAAIALRNNDIALFEDLLNQSHQSLKYDYEVSGTELDVMVEVALQHESCNAARMTGAGFGGCAIALVKENAFADFKTFVEQQYSKRTQLQGEVYLCNIQEGVKQIE